MSRGRVARQDTPTPGAGAKDGGDRSAQRRSERLRPSPDTFGDAIATLLGGPTQPGATRNGGNGTERLINQIKVSEHASSDRSNAGEPARTAAHTPTLKLIKASGAGAAKFPELLASRWGPNYLDVPETLRRIHELPEVRLIDHRVQRWLLENVAPRTGLRPEDWSRGQTIGVVADVYISDLTILARRFGQYEDAVRDKLLDLVTPESLRLFREVARGPESVLLMGLHAGAYQLSKYVIAHSFQDRVRLGATGRHGEIASVREDPTRALFQLIRHLRSSGSIAGMRGDGNFKGATHPVSVFGRVVNLGLGGAHAAYHSNCRTVFNFARWDGDKVVMDVVEGPRREPAERIEEWTNRWFQAFGKFLERVALSDPRNCRGYGGLWPNLGGLKPNK